MKRTKTPYDIAQQELRIKRYYWRTRIMQGNGTIDTYKRIGKIASRYIENIREHVGYVIYCPDYNPAFADLTRDIYAGY